METRRRARGAPWWVTRVGLLIGALALAGCGTINSYAGGCPAPFSGVRTDHEYLRSVTSLRKDGLRQVMLVGDLPLSALVDTLTLPIGAWAEQPPPTPVSPGCRWAIPRR